MTLRARPSGLPLVALALSALMGCSDALPLYDSVSLGAAGAGAMGGSSAGLGGTGGSSAGTGGSGGTGAAGANGQAGGSGSCPPSQTVLGDFVDNARDLGGIPLEGGGSVKCGMLFRGPPLNLTPDGCGHYQELGVRVLVDLRLEGERGGKMDAACTTEGATVISAPLPIPYCVCPTDYLADLNTLDSMALIFHALGTEAGYPMYFHCTWGRDRTGIVAAVILLALGASRETIMTDYSISAETVGAYPASLEATLDELERRGGVEGYFAELGVTAGELAFLREHATER